MKIKRSLALLTMLLCILYQSAAFASYAKASDIPDFEKIFELLLEKRHQYNAINDSVFTLNDESQWMQHVLHRAEVNYLNYNSNQALIDSATYYFLEPQNRIDATSGKLKFRSNIPDEAFDSLWEAINEKSILIDPFIGEIFVGNILIPHYESINNRTEKQNEVLAHLYLNYGDYLYNMFCMGDSASLSHSYQMLHKSYDISRLCEEGSKGYLFGIMSCAHMLSRPRLKAYTGFSNDEFNKVYDSFVEDREKYSDLIKSSEHYEYYSSFFYMSSTYHIMDLRQHIILEEGDAKETAKIQELLDDPEFLKKLDQEIQIIDSTEFYSTLMLFEARRGNIDYRTAFENCQKKYVSHIPFNSMATFTHSFRICVYSILDMLYLMDHANFSDPEKLEITNKLAYKMLNLLSQRPDNQVDSHHTNLLSLVLRNPVFIANLPWEERNNFYNQCFMALSPHTLAHYTLVSEYALTIYDAVLEQNPSALVDVLSYRNVYEVLTHSDDIKEFMRFGSMVHDIGKMRMEQIINNEFRKLTDHEFNIIKYHSEYSLDLLHLDPYLRQYEEFSLGHHRWYDGSKGYPMWYDNTQAHDRILVDILTIADCLEAATNRMSRNFRRSKSFSDVVAEFEKEAGTRYNPDVVAAIVNSKVYSAKLEDQVKNSWKVIFHNIFYDKQY